jgi:transposase-like protein
MSSSAAAAGKTQEEEEEAPLPDHLHYESHYFAEKQACRECGSNNVYTRVYFHKETLHARWLCRNCSEDYVEKRGYQLLQCDVQY